MDKFSNLCVSSRWAEAYPCAKADAEVINKIFLQNPHSQVWKT